MTPPEDYPKAPPAEEGRDHDGYPDIRVAGDERGLARWATDDDVVETVPYVPDDAA